MSRVAFMDSTGVGALILAHKRGVALTLTKVPAPLLRWLEILGLPGVFTVLA